MATGIGIMNDEGFLVDLEESVEDKDCVYCCWYWLYSWRACGC